MKNEFLEKAVFYEIYPTSFYDANGDGIGDIRGIIQKLPYVQSLGANAIWLNPMFASPFKDGGYDVSDYTKVDPMFGTNEDMKELFFTADKLGIKILLDLVMGHTSVEHPWFQQSQKAEKNEYTDAYVWQPGAEPLMNKDGKYISGWADRPDMFMINFYVWQPALNFGFYKKSRPWQMLPTDPEPMKNRERLKDVCRFWLKMGAAGFRVDMANFMVKNDTPDKRANCAFWKDVIGDIKKDYPDSIFVSEWFYPTQAVKNSAFDIDFNSGFPLYAIWGQKRVEDAHANSYFGSNSNRCAFFGAERMFRHFARAIAGRGYQAITLGNHDRERMACGRSISAMKTLFAYHFTAPHVPFLYYGDEVGINYLPKINKDGGYNRTGARTPMQWTEGKNRGFSDADSALYLPVEQPNGRSVAAQMDDADSLLNTVKQLIKLKKELKCLRVDAKYKVLRGKLLGAPLVYCRESDTDQLYAVLLPKAQPQTVKLPFLKQGIFECLTHNLEVNGTTAKTQTGEAYALFWKKR